MDREGKGRAVLGANAVGRGVRDREVLPADARVATDPIDERLEAVVSTDLVGLRDVDALVVVTEWREFRSPDFDQIRECLNRALIIDGRNIYDPNQLRKLGFEYFAIGRGDSLAA